MSIHGGTGGHSGSESGWTMYIGSHISGNENYNDEHGHSREEQYRSYHNRHRGVDAESDDSMASDASSGPSHQELPCVNGEGRTRTEHFKHTDDDEHSSKSYSKQAKQRDERRVKKPEKEKPTTHNHKVNSAASYVRSKARKNK